VTAMQAPGKQDNYEIARKCAFEAARYQTPEFMPCLGAAPTGPSAYSLPVLNVTFHIDLAGEKIRVSLQDGTEADPASPNLCWQVIALHYLAARPLERQAERWVAFPDFPEIRGYESVYKGRVLGRLCATAGRDRDTFTQACLRLGATPAECGDVGFEFRVFPALSLRIAWYAGDEEFPPAVSFLFPEDILTRLPLEDTIVLSESIVALLQGKRW